ncbi:MAG: tetratricopeptide repeat protein [Burkholderiales bacterium]
MNRVYEAKIAALTGNASAKDQSHSLQLARSYLQQGRINEAIAVADILVTEQNISPDTIAFLVQLGIVAHQKTDLASAENIYRKILAVNPANVDALHLLGLTFFQRNQYPAALELVEKSIQLCTNTPPHFLKNAGQIAQQMQNPSLAEKYFRQAISLNNTYEEGYTCLIQLLGIQGRIDEARQLEHEWQAQSRKTQSKVPVRSHVQNHKTKRKR